MRMSCIGPMTMLRIMLSTKVVIASGRAKLCSERFWASSRIRLVGQRRDSLLVSVVDSCDSIGDEVGILRSAKIFLIVARLGHRRVLALSPTSRPFIVLIVA